MREIPRHRSWDIKRRGRRKLGKDIYLPSTLVGRGKRKFGTDIWLSSTLMGGGSDAEGHTDGSVNEKDAFQAKQTKTTE